MSMSDPVTVLSPFDGKPVVRSTIAVTNAGDGLSDALGIDPQGEEHADGQHQELRDGCPDCDAERAAEASES